MVLKPAELTPLTALRLAQLIEEVGLPAGRGQHRDRLRRPRRARRWSSTRTSTRSPSRARPPSASRSSRAAAGNLKRVSLELGGKSPVIVFPDADLEPRRIAVAAHGIFCNTGQVCVAGSRLFAHENVFDEIVEGVADRAKKLKVGAGHRARTEMGPLISQKQLDRVLGYIDAGQEQGAEIVTGGERIERERLLRAADGARRDQPRA